jgi:DNA-binding transcriptional ArsR family regulator
MSSQTDRLERLITDRRGDCCAGDIEHRLKVLRSYRSEFPATCDADRTTLETLGDETRYNITRLLAVTDRALCVCEITPVATVSESAVSHALSDLHDAGLVTRHKEGKWRYYEATERARTLLEALDRTRGES